MSDKQIPAKYRFINVALLVIAALVLWWSYPYLPELIPVHWNLAGEADDWMEKPWGAAVLPLTMLATWLLFEVLSVISPKGFKLNDFINTVGVLMVIIQTFLLFLYVLQTAVTLGYPLPMTTAVVMSVGLLLTLTGNYLGKLQKNFFIGIRTPWTIASPTVWYRTHRLAGKLFVAAGLALLILPLLIDAMLWILIPAVLVAAIIPAGYSLWLYKRLERQGQLDTSD